MQSILHPSRVTQLVADFNSGDSPESLAHEYDIPIRQVCRYLKAHGLRFDPGISRVALTAKQKTSLLADFDSRADVREEIPRLARDYVLGESTVRTYLIEAGHVKPQTARTRKRELGEDERISVIDLYDGGQGLSMKKLAAQFKISEPVIRETLIAAGVDVRRGNCRSKVPRTQQLRWAIARLNGHTLRALASEYGVSLGTISNNVATVGVSRRDLNEPTSRRIRLHALQRELSDLEKGEGLATTDSRHRLTG